MLENQIKQIRESKGMTFYRLSALSGVKRDTLVKIEESRISPTWKTLCKIFTAFGMDEVTIKID